METSTCEDCHAPSGGEVVIKNADGKVVWRRVLCDECFHIRRRNTEAQDGVRIAVVGQA